MGRIEVITRAERRRKYSPSEREAIMREADAPDVTVREVAKRHDIAESLIYSWRTPRRQAESNVKPGIFLGPHRPFCYGEPCPPTRSTFLPIPMHCARFSPICRRVSLPRRRWKPSGRRMRRPAMRSS